LLGHAPLVVAGPVVLFAFHCRLRVACSGAVLVLMLLVLAPVQHCWC
jgi:hypothetical protein